MLLRVLTNFARSFSHPQTGKGNHSCSLLTGERQTGNCFFLLVSLTFPVDGNRRTLVRQSVQVVEGEGNGLDHRSRQTFPVDLHHSRGTTFLTFQLCRTVFSS